jgi:hypothetical protein
MVAPFDGIISRFDHPSHIIDEFLALLSNLLEGQTGSHIDHVVQRAFHKSNRIGVQSDGDHLSEYQSQ